MPCYKPNPHALDISYDYAYNCSYFSHSEISVVLYEFNKVAITKEIESLYNTNTDIANLSLKSKIVVVRMMAIECNIRPVNYFLVMCLLRFNGRLFSMK
jgi:hypothetical protein